MSWNRKGVLWSTAALVSAAVAVSGCTGPATADDPTTVHPLPSVRPTTPSTGGQATDVGSSPFGAHWDQGRVSNFSAYLARMRGSVSFYEATWCKMEPTPGYVKWRKLDRVIQTARRFDITLMVKIRTGTCWATTGEAQHVRGHADKTESSMPRSMDQYTTFVKELVARARAGGVNEFAVENEVNSPSYWSGTPEDYVKLVTQAARAIRSVAPHAVVADAGLSSTSYGYGICQRLLDKGQVAAAIAAWNTYYVRRIGTRGDQIPEIHDEATLRSTLSSTQGQRNLAYLQATRQLLQDGIVHVRQVHFYEKWDAVPMLMGFLHAETPRGVPIEAWEVGSYWVGAPADDQLRADEMVKTLSLLVAGGVRRAVWLPLVVNPDNRHGAEVRYGLLDPEGTVRATGAAARALVQYSKGASAKAVDSAGLQGVAFERGGQVALIVWSRSGTTSVRVGSGARAGAVDAQVQPSGPSVSVGSRPEVLVTSQPLSQVLG